MNFNEYRPLALRTAKMFPAQRENLRHAALGLMTEIGEFATEVKRIVIYGKPLTDEMRLHMIEEIGDVQWYVPLALLALGADEVDTSSCSLSDMMSNPASINWGDMGDLCLILGTCSTGVASCVAIDQINIDRQMLVEVLRGLIWVIDNHVAPLLGVHPDDIRAQNIAKLRLRFPDAYTDQAAEARADKGGLPASVS